MAESNFNPFARIARRALGIAQFMPATAKAMGLRDRLDAEASIDAQAHLMRDLLRRFGSVPLALAAYNAGPAPVAACGCVPPIPETRGYVARILGCSVGRARPPATEGWRCASCADRGARQSSGRSSAWVSRTAAVSGGSPGGVNVCGSQLRALRVLGCDAAPGPLLAAPGDASEIGRLVVSPRRDAGEARGEREPHGLPSGVA